MSTRLERLLEQLRAVRSDIDVYKLMVGLKRDATPLEIETLASATPRFLGNEELRRQMRQLQTVVFKGGRVAEPFQCIDDSPAFTYYRGAAEADQTLFAFCGKAQILFGPIARVLQRLPATRFDVMVLRDPSKIGFTEGMPGLSESFAQAILLLKERYARGRRIQCIGTSGGGGPALVAAIVADAANAVNFSGRIATASLRYGQSPGALAMDALLRNRDRQTTRLHSVFSAGHEVDAAKAAQLYELTGAISIAIPDTDQHNVLHQLDLRGELESILERTGIL